MGDAGTALQKLREALGEAPGLGDIIGNADAAEQLGRLADSMADMGAALGTIGAALRTIRTDVDLDWNQVRAGLDQLSSAMDALRGASIHTEEVLQYLGEALEAGETLSGQMGDAMKQLQKVTDAAGEAGKSLKAAFTDLSDAVDALKADGPVEFEQLGEEYRAAGEELYGALAEVSAGMAALNGAVSAAGKTLTADLRAVNDQFNVVFQLLISAMNELEDGVQGGGLSDYLEDTSDQDISATRLGKTADSVNKGGVEGDRNVGGVVGTMAIEYGLDPEDDLHLFNTKTYETKAVLERCVNRGSVAAKKDCAGGLAGRMDLGTVILCENYGNVESTGGDYVGGAAGLSEGTIRETAVKCTLSGRDYVGGVAGSASVLRDNRAVAKILSGTEYVGAIAGMAEPSSNAVKGNYFLYTGVDGIDGISYSGCAQRADFEELQALPGVPDELCAFTLTLRADEKIVKVINFTYGEDLSALALPAPPEKEGYYGRWPEFDMTGRSSDLVLDAVYTPWATMLASRETENGLSLALAEGVFTEDAVLHVAKSAVAPPNGVEREACKVWELVIDGADLSADSGMPLRLFCGEEKAAVWQYVDGRWRKVESAANGQYRRLIMEGTGGVFCVQTGGTGSGAWLYAAAAGAAAVLLAVVLLLRGLRKKKAGKREPVKT